MLVRQQQQVGTVKRTNAHLSHWVFRGVTVLPDNFPMQQKAWLLLK